MESFFTIGEILWVKGDGKPLPIEILNVRISEKGQIIYTFCNARDDALRRENGEKDNYFEIESTLKERVL